MGKKEDFSPGEAIRESLRPAERITKFGIGYLAAKVGGKPASSEAGRVFKKIVDVLGWSSEK